MALEHLLVPRRAHSFIINVQPSFLTIVVSVPVEHVNRIAPAASGPVVVVKHSMELIVRWLRRFLNNGAMISGPTENLSYHWGKEMKKNRT